MHHPIFKNAHPLAKRLMDEEFYYSATEESAPFGNDDGSDTFAGFCQWRSSNPQASPLVYLQGQLLDWGYPSFDLHEKNSENIQSFVNEHEMGVTLLIGMDAAILAVAFGQLYLEGRMEEEVLALAKTA